MKAGLKLWSTNFTNYFQEALSLYERGLYSYIELYVVPDSLVFIDDWKKLKIPFTIHCPHSAHGFNLAKSELRRHNQSLFEEVRKYADRLSADYIVIHGGLDGTVEETARQLKALNEPRALIENKPYRSVPGVIKDVKVCVGNNLEELQLVKEESGCGFCLDFGHAVCASNSYKKDCFDYIGELMTLKPQMFHLTDITDMKSDIDAHPHLGHGYLDLKRIGQYLPEDAKVTLETVKQSKTSLNDFIEDANIFKDLKKQERKTI